MSFCLTPDVGPVPLTILNQSAVSVTLQQSPDNVTFTAVMNEFGQAVVAQAAFASVFNLSPSGYYRLANLSGGAITAGTVWVTR